MTALIKSPFNSDDMEKDPMVYGLRPIIIRQSINELYNEKSLLITGARGIGKSSLAYQLQRILNGDSIILSRCGMSVDFPAYITINYTCTSDDTLESLVLMLISKLEENISEIEPKYKVKVKSIDFSFFGIAKTAINVDKNQKTEYSTLAESFIKVIRKFSEIYVDPHINIVIDELDQLDDKYNIAHFTKVVLEQLSQYDNNYLSFIFVGQNILYDKLYQQQPAFFRLFKHIVLNPLDDDNSEYVLDACLNRCAVNINIESDGKELLLGMSGGYPFSIQLIGHESFNCMLEKYEVIDAHILKIKIDDVLSGIKNSIISEKERFYNTFEALNHNEKNYLTMMIEKQQREIPFIYPFNYFVDGIAIENKQEKRKQIIEVLQSLENKQILLEMGKSPFTKWEDKKFRFREELFRVYLVDVFHNDDSLDYE